MKRFWTLPFLLLMTPSAIAQEFTLEDGDRVVFLGGTLIEREQRYGYWETELTSRFPDKHVTFRNLGWSGDTVWGEARAGFDNAAAGYKRLIDHTLSLKPRVIFLGYGANESFAGEEGLPRFQKQLDKLLDDLASSKARVVLMAPPLSDVSRWPQGKPDDRNRDLKLYTGAIKKIAEKRKAFCMAEFCQSYGPANSLTDNGIHLTAYGYWWTKHCFLNELKLAEGRRLKTIELTGEAPVRSVDRFLPGPPLPREWEGEVKDHAGDCWIRARDLKPGKYTLKIDGQPVHTADAEAWMKPERFEVVVVPKGPSLGQAEKLRLLIVEKNQLYFHRYRPQNDTYLFGFRKHEQGKNAKEIPEFDPFIEKLEKEIAKLKVPVTHTYELVPVREEKK